MNLLKIIGRKAPLLEKDIQTHTDVLRDIIANSKFLVIGGAGSIGQAVTKEIFKRNPLKLHVVDISENNLVELVRDIRSSFGYIRGDFRTFALDCGSFEFDFMVKEEGGYDYILNLSALKHVRSEKDPYTLMRMIEVNILNTLKTIDYACEIGAKKYFCVSTDKAANPVNMMGASKRIMEMFLMHRSRHISISTARFANVAFSDGSLLHGFSQRLQKKQPLAAPNDVRRYFVTSQEAGQLCLISTLLGENKDIIFPKLNRDINLVTFSSIAKQYLQDRGYEPYLCGSEDEARSLIEDLIANKKWPCCFFPSNTTGEKGFEEFHTADENIDLERFSDLGVVKNTFCQEEKKLSYFLEEISKMRKVGYWTKEQITALFLELIPNLSYREMGRFLDDKM